MDRRLIVNIIGILLILFGALTFGYHGITYKTEENVVRLGDLKLSSEENKIIRFNPWVSGASIAVGLILIVGGNMRRKP